MAATCFEECMESTHVSRWLFARLPFFSTLFSQTWIINRTECPHKYATPVLPDVTGVLTSVHKTYHTLKT